MSVTLGGSPATPLAGEIVVGGPGGPGKPEACVTGKKNLGFGVRLIGVGILALSAPFSVTCQVKLSEPQFPSSVKWDSGGSDLRIIVINKRESN